ncbi:hypothetical protein MTP99_013720 [Tenebrio molitor]|nr:hypothetical protein MTP99_013720 [Tenebrio molitor]
MHMHGAPPLCICCTDVDIDPSRFSCTFGGCGNRQLTTDIFNSPSFVSSLIIANPSNFNAAPLRPPALHQTNIAQLTQLMLKPNTNCSNPTTLQI